MKNVLKYMFLALFVFASVACTEVGTNNKVANGDVELVEENPDTDETTNETTNDEIESDTNTAEKTPAPKEPNSPEALVDDLYKEEEKENSPFFQDKDRALVDRFFTKDLADMIWKDAVETTDDEVGALEFDPLYDAQDAEVAELKVGNSQVKGEKAIVTVTFLNFGEEKSVKYQLVKVNGKWKIEDINYGKETLKQIFKQGKSTETDTDE